MRAETCAGCPHLAGGVCGLKAKRVAEIRGCSRSPAGRKFFRARSGVEAIRVKMNQKKETEA
jgi:hypothetical protein